MACAGACGRSPSTSSTPSPFPTNYSPPSRFRRSPVALEFKHANAIEGVRFTAQVGVPNVVQGLFRKREIVVSTVGKLPADYLAYRLVEGLARKYGPDPFWVRVGAEETLLLTHPDDIKAV